MAILENGKYRFVVEKECGTFHIDIGEEHTLLISDNQIHITGRLSEGTPFSRPLRLQKSIVPPTHLCPEARSLAFSGMEEDLGLAWKLAITLSENGDLMQWKVFCVNKGQDDLMIEKIHLLQPAEPARTNCHFYTDDAIELRFYTNGWQSWSYSAAYGKHDRMRRSKLGFLQEPMVINPSTPLFRQKDRFSSDMFAALADHSSGQGIALGFLSQEQQYGTITADLRDGVRLCAWAACDGVRLETGAALQTDWFAIAKIDAHAPQPLNAYLEAAACENEVGEMQAPPAGWCSWYHYYQDINEEKILSNLDQVHRIQNSTPLTLFQIDDGFQAQVGDWLSFSDHFPNGVRPLADAIKKAGLTSGIWLAPFIVHPRSRLAKEHPDWLLRKANGKLVRAGFVWNSLGLALDLTVPEALAYACEVIRTAVHEWGFTYLKLDFLYAAALPGIYRDRTKTRAQVLRMGMQAIRESAGKDVVLLGCGAPLGSMIGLVDMMRIGADVSGHWKPDYAHLGFLFKSEPHMPSARNAIQNTITRAMLHNTWWVNDPDCLLVREDTGLSLHEVQTLATAIALTGGSILVSDDMAALSPHRLKILQSLLPPINQRAWVLDWLERGTPSKMRLDLHGAAGDWYLLSTTNYSSRPQLVCLTMHDFGLEDKRDIASEFWSQTTTKVEQGTPLFEGVLASHQTLLLAVRPYESDIAFAGSSLHISQGLEVKHFEKEEHHIRIMLDPGHTMEGTFCLAQPTPPQRAMMDGKDIPWEKNSTNIYRYHLINQPPGMLEIWL